jgi:hypothetical protein
MAASQAWADFLVNLREVTNLLRADPGSAYSIRRAMASGAAAAPPSIGMTTALTKGCVLLVSGRLQGCIESRTEEFLERIDQSGVIVDRIPEVLRASLCRLYFGRPTSLSHRQTTHVHLRYAVLWTSGSPLPPGTLKTNSLPNSVWNPWPDKVQELLARCDIDLFSMITTQHGVPYLNDMKEYVKELISFRNAVAHGDSPASNWSAADVRLRIRWVTRLARACDEALDRKLLDITGRGWSTTVSR